MNLPNKLSLSRIIISPVMMFFYLADFLPYGIGKWIALGLFVIGAITDFLDGYIARKYKLITDLGKFLDPIGDKLLVTFALILVTTDGIVPLPYGAIALAIIVGRDLVVDMLRFVAAGKGIVIAADWFGKYKTTTQDFAMLFLLLYSGLRTIVGLSATIMLIIMWIAFTLLIVAVLLTILSMINYILKNKAIFVQNK